MTVSIGAVAGTETDSRAARDYVKASIEAMGGEDRLRSIHSDELEGIGHRNMLEQSERPEGPWLLDYFEIKQTRDFVDHRLLEQRRSRGCDSTECWASAKWQESTLVVADRVAAAVKAAKMTAGSMSALQSTDELLSLGPERALLTALDAADLRIAPDRILHGFPHHVVEFTWQKQPVRIYLSSYTLFPTMIELTRARPYNVYWAAWGDVTTRTTFSFWQLEPGGLHYPRQWNFETNGQPDWVLTVNDIHLNVPLTAKEFAIPDEIKTNFATHARSVEDIPLGSPANPPQELAPGVVELQGAWNVTEVRQADGIVIIEAPISNGYSTRVIADAERRFPGLKVKALITTSDSWPHIGGVREYAARGIPIYALDLNRPILERLLRAPHLQRPDALQMAPRSASIRYVSGATALGQGENRMVVYPLREVTGERQMMVYFPAHKVLYSSDLFQRAPSGEFFLPETLWEAVNAVHRERLEVTTDVGMHLGPTPWEAIEAAVHDRLSTAPLSSG